MMVKVIGAGLAGSEAAWQLAQRGIAVELYEMKPQKMSPAHHSENFGELVCSNSLRGDRLENAVGLLKEELRRCGSLIMECAEATRVEAGGCLAVDRFGFSAMVTEKIKNHPNITVTAQEVTEVPEGPVIIATGPLTSDALSDAIGKYFGQTDYLHFFDAAAPIVTRDSIDMESAFTASRYERGGEDDYINCPMTKEQYDYEYEDHVIFDNGKICMYKCWGNTYYVGKDVKEELYEFYLEDIDKVRIEFSDNGDIICHWDDDSFPSILDIVEAEGFPIHFKLFKDYGIE